jgi:hypothetical protein
VPITPKNSIPKAHNAHCVSLGQISGIVVQAASMFFFRSLFNFLPVNWQSR